MKKRIETLIKLGVFSAIVMHLINISIESCSALRNLLTNHNGAFYNWKNYNIFYQKRGEGSPLLLLHNLNPASSSFEWSEMEEKLSKNHTVYTVDLPGCGRSDKPNITYTNYFYVLFLTDFIKNVIKEKTSVMSTGLSGSFVIMAANMEPDLFEDITLINPESLGKLDCIPDHRSKIMKSIMNCPILGTSLYYLMTSETQIEYYFTEKYFYNPFHLPNKTMHTYYESAHKKQGNGKYLLSSIEGHYVNNTIRFALPKLTLPIHVVFGRELENAEKICQSYQELNPNIRISYVEKTKMLPQLEAPDKLLSII